MSRAAPKRFKSTSCCRGLIPRHVTFELRKVLLEPVSIMSGAQPTAHVHWHRIFDHLDSHQRPWLCGASASLDTTKSSLAMTLERVHAFRVAFFLHVHGFITHTDTLENQRQANYA